MAFSSQVVERQRSQFQGLFSEMWLCTGVKNYSSVAAGAEALDNFTVPGLQQGDMVLGWSADIAIDTDIIVFVQVDNGLIRVMITNVGSGSVDLANATWKFLIGRPTW